MSLTYVRYSKKKKKWKSRFREKLFGTCKDSTSISKFSNFCFNFQFKKKKSSSVSFNNGAILLYISAHCVTNTLSGIENINAVSFFRRKVQRMDDFPSLVSLFSLSLSFLLKYKSKYGSRLEKREKKISHGNRRRQRSWTKWKRKRETVEKDDLPMVNRDRKRGIRLGYRPTNRTGIRERGEENGQREQLPWFLFCTSPRMPGHLASCRDSLRLLAGPWRLPFETLFYGGSRPSAALSFFPQCVYTRHWCIKPWMPALM